ncbi:hypothetical protein FPS10_24675 [Pseudoruegeria sp. M32A2M]|nr:hypothetical protein [Pseudoruegeria sp. M32A2M]
MAWTDPVGPVSGACGLRDIYAARLGAFAEPDRASGHNVVGAPPGIEGAHPFQGEIANLDRLEAAGHRVIGLQHL